MNNITIELTEKELEILKSSVIKKALYYVEEEEKELHNKEFWINKRNECIQLFNRLNNL